MENEKLKTVNIDNIEIFSVGTQTDMTGKTKTFTVDDLNNMVIAANELGEKLDIPVKLGHNENQKLLQADGLPAAGWLKNLRVSGSKLVADMKQVPRKIADLIRAGAYKHQSIEINHDYKDSITGTVYKNVVTGLALLGVDLPAVTNLAAIHALYSNDILKENPENLSIYISNTISPDGDAVVAIADKDKFSASKKSPLGGKRTMDEKEIKALQDENAALKKEIADAKANFEKAQTEFEKYKSEASKHAAAVEGEKSEFSKSISEFKALREADGAKIVDLEKRISNEEQARVIAEKELFFSKFSRKCTPADLPEKKELYDYKRSQGAEKLEEFKSAYAAKPDHEFFTQVGADDGSNPKGEDDYSEIEKRRADYAKEKGLDLNKAGDFATADMAVRTYRIPATLGGEV